MVEQSSNHVHEGEMNYYFADESMPDVEVSHFLPGAGSIPDEEIHGDENVPKAYDVSDSMFTSALEDEEIREFKHSNYRNIRHAGKYLDGVLFDIDNDQEMLEPDIRNRLTEAFQSIMNVKQRVEEFEPEDTSLIYSDESKQEFKKYLDSLANKIKVAGWRERINVEREHENRQSNSFDAYTALEPEENLSSGRAGFTDSDKVEEQAD